MAVLPFIGGESGPETLISDTKYYDTFDTGYGGRFRRQSKMRPYFLGSLGIVNLSSIDVTVDGEKMANWNQTVRDYLEMGVGI